MRVAHITDIHWEVMPSLRDLSPKRILGSLNLYVRGRHHHFTEQTQTRLVNHVVDLAPDAVFITGDLTAQALDSEFRKARQALTPILDRFPTLIIPGNHDVYTRGAQRSQRMRAHFGPWMGLERHGCVARLDYGELTLLGLDPNRPLLIHASGEIPADQLDTLAAILADPDLSGRRILLGIHHPPVDRQGALYDGLHHGLVNAGALAELLESAPTRPEAILCGHVHHGFRSQLGSGATAVAVFDSGSSGYARDAARDRAACMNVYDLGGALTVQRYRDDGSVFRAEEGGAYATGR